VAILEFTLDPVPRLSLCIPTSPGRAAVLKVALASAIQEALAHPAGTVEVLVSDNGSPEDTKALLREFQACYPWLRLTGFVENQGFDPNYLNCVEQAQGEFVWVMGDDDMFLPGSVARVLAALDAGADAILCGAYECDVRMKPLRPREWFREPTPAAVWQLDTREDLKGYLDKLQYEAGAFAFISAAIFRRERFLEGLPVIRTGIGYAFVHTMGMMLFLKQPTRLHWIPQPLFLNRLGNDDFAARDPWGRLMHDLNAWIWIAGGCFADDPGLHRAFMGVLRRNQDEQHVRLFRQACGDDRARWEHSREQLLRVGYPAESLNVIEYACQVASAGFRPSPSLDPDGLCLGNLALLARGARRIAVVAVGAGDPLAQVQRLLAAFRDQLGAARIRVVGPQAWAAPLAPVEVQGVDGLRLERDPGYRAVQLDALEAFGPELVVNADPARGLAGDLLAAAARAQGSLALAGPGAADRNGRYNLLASPGADWPVALCAALGLERPAPDPGPTPQAGAGSSLDPALVLPSRPADAGPVLASARRLALGFLSQELPPPQGLHSRGACLTGLPLVTRAARRIAVLAVVGLDTFLAATALLEALRTGCPAVRIRVVCPGEWAPLLAGFELQILDRAAFLRDDACMNGHRDAIRAFAPELLVNVDRARGITGDLLAEAALAMGSLGFEDEGPADPDDTTRTRRSLPYRRLLPAAAPFQALAQALGLGPGHGRLWLDAQSRDRAVAILGAKGWDPQRTLVVLGDDPAALAGPCARALGQAGRAGRTAIGIGGRGTGPALAQALAPFGGRALNLGGELPLEVMAALLQGGGPFLGGGPVFQALARAAGAAEASAEWI